MVTRIIGQTLRSAPTIKKGGCCVLCRSCISSYNNLPLEKGYKEGQRITYAFKGSLEA